MAQTVLIQSTQRVMTVFNLDRSSRKKRVFPVVRTLKNGTSVGVMEAKLLPDSITFLAKERKEVPATVLTAPEIAQAISDGRLRKVEAVAPKPKEVPTSAASAAARSLAASTRKPTTKGKRR